MHGTCAISKIGMPKYSNGLTGTPADSNLRKLTASHFQVLITQNANKNMPNMFLIVYLNENLRYCNENLVWGKQEPLVHPYMLWYTTKGEKVAKLHFTLFTYRYHNLKTFQIIFLLNTNIPHLLSTVRLCSPYRAPKQPVWIGVSAPVYVYLIVVSSSNPFPQLHWQNQQGTQKGVFFHHCVASCDLVEILGFFLLLSGPTEISALSKQQQKCDNPTLDSALKQTKKDVILLILL